MKERSDWGRTCICWKGCRGCYTKVLVKYLEIQCYGEVARFQEAGESGRRAAATLRPSSTRRLYVEHAFRYKKYREP